MPQIRGVFPLPQTSPQISGVVQKVELVGGGVYVMPAGNYLVSCGATTVLQWWDPIETMWRVVTPARDYTHCDSDGTNYRLVNMSGMVQGATITTPGSGGTNGIGPVQTGTTIGFAAPAAPGIAAEGYVVIGGACPNPQLVQGGANYVVPPVIACDPPPVGGRQATFVATINAAGAIATVNVVDPGAGYTSVPQFYIVPQPKYYQGSIRWPGDQMPPQPMWPAPGTISPMNVWPGTVYQPNITMQGALIMGQPLVGAGTVTAITMTANGSGYGGVAPAITFTGGPLTGAAATAAPSLSMVATGTPPLVALGGTTTVGQVVTVPGAIPATLVAVDTAGNFQIVNPGLGIAPGAIASNGTAVPAAALGGSNDISYLQAKVT